MVELLEHGTSKKIILGPHKVPLSTARFRRDGWATHPSVNGSLIQFWSNCEREALRRSKSFHAERIKNSYAVLTAVTSSGVHQSRRPVKLAKMVTN